MTLKAALQSLTLYLASFIGKRGITVKALAPGGLDDDFSAPLIAINPQARGYIVSRLWIWRCSRWTA
jgi:NAD(P)-dependent dehydrogenase (short-subunit alcohol dehydrogenase family)